MKWDNDKGHTDALLPLLKAIHSGGKVKKVFIEKHPELVSVQGKTEEGEQFLQKCLELFPFLKGELND